jgi:cell division protein FtsZ
VIAAGFDSGQLPYKKVEVRREEVRPPVQAPPANASAPTNGRPAPQNGRPAPQNGTSSAANGTPPQEREPAGRWPLPSSGIRRTPVNLDDELDVPDFLKS